MKVNSLEKDTLEQIKSDAQEVYGHPLKNRFRASAIITKVDFLLEECAEGTE